MEHPFYNPAALTDDEILTKLRKCYGYLSAQQRLGHDPTVNSINQVIEALEMEKSKRFEKIMKTEQTKHNPDLLKPIELGTIETLEQEKNNENRY